MLRGAQQAELVVVMQRADRDARERRELANAIPSLLHLAAALPTRTVESLTLRQGQGTQHEQRGTVVPARATGSHHIKARRQHAAAGLRPAASMAPERAVVVRPWEGGPACKYNTQSQWRVWW